jgi:copper chaperone
MCITTTANGELGLADKNSGCTCSTDAHGHGHADTATIASTAPTVDYLVAGMTCSHCVASVTEELEALEGVEAVSVALNAGGTSKVTVAATTPLDDDAVRAAIDEAGYSLVTA